MILKHRHIKNVYLVLVRRISYTSYHIPGIYFERSEFLIDTSPKKSLRVCTRARVPCVRLLLVLVCRIMYHIRTYLSSAPKIRICRYVCTRATSPPQKKEQKAQHRLRERHTHNATVIAQQGACNNYGQRYRGCTCCLMDTESLMIRRPFGSIDPNSIRETELHTECRGRHNRGERESLHRPQLHRERDAARQRAAATRMREIDEERAERCVFHCLRCQQPYTLGAAAK